MNKLDKIIKNKNRIIKTELNNWTKLDKMEKWKKTIKMDKIEKWIKMDKNEKKWTKVKK